MKLCIVRHHFFLWFLIDKPELLPFEGNWNTLIVLANESGRILSDITKHGNIIHVEKYGLEIDFKTFMNILNVPNSSIADLVNHSQNLILHSDDEYSVAKFAKTHNLVYGYVFNPTTNNLFYYVVNRTYPSNLTVESSSTQTIRSNFKRGSLFGVLLFYLFLSFI